MSFITKEKRLEYRKRYIEKHGRDKINADQRKRTKKFRDKNPEKSKEYQRTYKKKNFEKWKTYHRLKNECIVLLKEKRNGLYLLMNSNNLPNSHVPTVMGYSELIKLVVG